MDNMTTEQAIAWFEDAIQVVYMPDTKQAYLAAINALEDKMRGEKQDEE